MEDNGTIAVEDNGTIAAEDNGNRVWGRKSEPREDLDLPQILNREEWKLKGYRVFGDLRRNSNQNFYLTVVAPGGIAGSAYFSKKIQQLLVDNEFETGDSVAGIVGLVGLHIRKDENETITDLYIGALPNGNREEL